MADEAEVKAKADQDDSEWLIRSLEREAAQLAEFADVKRHRLALEKLQEQANENWKESDGRRFELQRKEAEDRAREIEAVAAWRQRSNEREEFRVELQKRETDAFERIASALEQLVSKP